MGIRPIKFKPTIRKPTGHQGFLRGGFPLSAFNPESGEFTYSNRPRAGKK